MDKTAEKEFFKRITGTSRRIASTPVGAQSDGHINSQTTDIIFIVALPVGNGSGKAATPLTARDLWLVGETSLKILIPFELLFRNGS